MIEASRSSRRRLWVPRWAGILALLLVGDNLNIDPSFFDWPQQYSQNMLPGTIFRDCPDCPEMVVIPAGSFVMGASAGEMVDPYSDISVLDQETGKFVRPPEKLREETPQHQVTIAHPFAMGRFDVTFAQWDACVADGGCTGSDQPDDMGWGRGRRPVLATWDNAQAYITWLNGKIKALTGTEGLYRLPSEAEWEYAARAGTTTPRWWKAGWWDRLWNANSTGTGYENCAECRGALTDFFRADKTTPVGSYRANPFGLYDILGDIHQMTADCWHENYVGAPDDGSAWMDGSCDYLSLRGAFVGSMLIDVRAAYRQKNHKGGHFSGGGIRLVRTLP